MFNSRSFRMAMEAFRSLHPDRACFLPKELTSDYRKRRLVEKAGGKVLVFIVHAAGKDAGRSSEAEAYTLYRIDHSSGQTAEVAFSVNDYATLCQKVQSAAVQGDLPPDLDYLAPSQERVAE